MQIPVSIIICTYNEEKTIENVVKSVCQYNPDRQVIVIDDGSTDSTPQILRHLSDQYNFLYERFEQNKGKSWAMVRGVELAKHEILVFFDADLEGIKPEHFEKLIIPIHENEADMVMGFPTETLMDFRITPFKTLTGERSLRKSDLLPILDEIRPLKFGIETYINLYYQSTGKKIKIVLLEGLKHYIKYKKTEPTTATKEFVKEAYQIFMTLIKNYDLTFQYFNTKANQTSKEIKKQIDILKNSLNQIFEKFSL